MRMEEKKMNPYLYIGAIVVVLGLVIIIAGIAANKRQARKAEAVQETILETVSPSALTKETEPVEDPAETEGRPVDEEENAKSELVIENQAEEAEGEYGDIEKLIHTYYEAYASGDEKLLQTCASPVSELEKGYIKLMGRFTKSTENIECHVNPGRKDGEYAISVVADMVLEGVEQPAPGLDFFYVRTDENGARYIDNAYCSFNTSTHMTETDKDILSFISDYESKEDFKAMQRDVQKRYDDIVASNEQLANKLLGEIPQAVNVWMDSLPDETKKAEEQEDAKEDTNHVIPGATLIVADSYNVRSSKKDDAKKIGSTKKGDELKIIKNYPDGWTKIEWDDETGYVKTKLLIENE